jgi:hypothetical protein
MKPKLRLSIASSAVTYLAVISLAGCGSSSNAAAGKIEVPVVLKPLAGTARFQVTLTEKSQNRLGIETSQVREAKVAVDGGKPAIHKIVPYAAVVYDSAGSTWAYSAAPGSSRSYLRTAITVVAVNGADAVLDAGPDVGTAVVVVGAPELLGAEAQIAGEE